jgi:uncharacterized protein involved in exopolysaccharide biosynthesis
MSSEIKFYWELIKKRMPVMAVIFVLCAGIGVGLALTMPPRYQASAALVVEGAALPDSLFTSTVQVAAARELQSIELRLMTRANLIDIAAKHRVFRGETGMSPDDVVRAMREATTFGLTPGGQDFATVLRLSFESEDPNIAADVVNEYVTYVLSADAERRRDGSGQTLEFFQNRVEALSRRLTEQSAEIVAYKEANNDALPESLDFRLDRQSRLQERLNLNARDRTSLTEQRARIVEAGAQAGLAGGAAMSPQQTELNRLETELRSKLAIYDPESPTIQFLERRIELLRADEIPGVPAATDSVRALLDLQLAGVDSEIRSIDQDSANIEAELELLQKAIERTPQVAIRLDELEREYENTQTQYNEAVRARSTAEQGVDVETSAKGERVALIEQAAVPRRPSSPNRKLIAGGGVFAGTALAAVFFVLTELINSAIRRPIDLTRGLGVQPLATIPYLEEESTRRRRHIMQMLFVVAVLITIPVGLWAIHTYYSPLDLLFEMIIERVGL